MRYEVSLPRESPTHIEAPLCSAAIPAAKALDRLGKSSFGGQLSEPGASMIRPNCLEPSGIPLHGCPVAFERPRGCAWLRRAAPVSSWMTVKPSRHGRDHCARVGTRAGDAMQTSPVRIRFRFDG